MSQIVYRFSMPSVYFGVRVPPASRVTGKGWIWPKCDRFRNTFLPAAASTPFFRSDISIDFRFKVSNQEYQDIYHTQPFVRVCILRVGSYRMVTTYYQVPEWVWDTCSSTKLKFPRRRSLAVGTASGPNLKSFESWASKSSQK